MIGLFPRQISYELRVCYDEHGIVRNCHLVKTEEFMPPHPYWSFPGD